ncbi:hypothetical protein D3C71_1297240 [compost metagenome]
MDKLRSAFNRFNLLTAGHVKLHIRILQIPAAGQLLRIVKIHLPIHILHVQSLVERQIQGTVVVDSLLQKFGASRLITQTVLEVTVCV